MRSAAGGGRISGCSVFKESHLFYTKSDLYSVLFVNKVCEYAGIARKAEEMLFFIRFFRPIRNKSVYLQPCPLSKLRCRNEEFCINKPNNFLIRMKIKMFMFAALAAFATLAGCSDDENNDGTGGGGTEDKPVPSEYEVEFKSTSYYSTTVTIKTITENAKFKYYMASFWESDLLKETISGDTPNKIAEGIINYYKLNYGAQGATMQDIFNMLTLDKQLYGVKPQSIPISNLTPDTEYSLVIAGINEEGKIVANGTVATFKTAALPDFEADDCTFDWSFTDTKSTYVTIKFVPSDREVPYFAYVLTRSDYASMFSSNPAELKEKMTSLIAQLSKAFGGSIPEFMNEMRMKGEMDFKLTGLTPETEYVAFVCGMDEYGRPTTDVSVKEFETVKYVASNATTESVKIELFDGDVASTINSSLYPSETFAGGWFLRFSPVFSESCSDVWMILVTDQDLSGKSDGELLVDILSRGNITDQNPVAIPRVQKDITAYTYVVAQTEEREPGNIFRCEPFEVKESNLGTMDDLFPDANSQNGTASVALSSVGKMRPTTVGAMKVVSVL